MNKATSFIILSFLMLNWLAAAATTPRAEGGLEAREPLTSYGAPAGLRRAIIINQLNLSRLNELVTLNLLFSQGEAYNGSIKVCDSKGMKVPSQVWEADFYKETSFYRSCKVSFLASLGPLENTTYFIHFSYSNTGEAYHLEETGLKVLGDGNRSDITIMNEYYRALIKANSTQAVYQLYKPLSNESIVWSGWGLPGFSFGVDGEFYGPADLEQASVRIMEKGPVFTLIHVSGARAKVLVELRLLFTSSPRIHVVSIFTNLGAKVDWFRPIQTLYTDSLYPYFILPEGEAGTIESTGFRGKSFTPTPPWWAISKDSGEGVLGSLNPLNLTRHLVIADHGRDFDILLIQGNETILKDRGSKALFQSNFLLLNNATSTFLNNEYMKLVNPLKVLVENPVATITMKAPREVEVDERFSVEAAILAVENCSNAFVKIKLPPSIISLQNETQYLGKLTKGLVKEASWNVKAKAEGNYTVAVNFTSDQGGTIGRASISIHLPQALPLKIKIGLRVMDLNANQSLPGLNVTMFSVDGDKVATSVSNKFGYVGFELKGGEYLIFIFDGNRVVGYQRVKVTKPDTFIIRCWTCNINLAVLDSAGNPLASHTVFLYDQLSFTSPQNYTLLNETGRLLGFAKTDVYGRAFFKGVWNGTYKVIVFGGRLVGEASFNLQEDRSLVIYASKANLALKLISYLGEPLFNATVQLYDGRGHLIFTDYSNLTGYVDYRGLYFDNYTIFVRMMGITVWSGIIRLEGYTSLTIKCSVYKISFHCKNYFGTPLSGAKIILRRVGVPSLKVWLNTDGRGYASTLLPHGEYDVQVSSGIYSSLTKVSLRENMEISITCSPQYNFFLASLLVTLPLIGLTIIIERRRGKLSLRARRYRSLLSNLDSLYEKGLIEYKIYRKLREEYEEEVRRFGRRF